MRGGLMRLWTVEEHTAILKAHDTNKGAAAEYNMHCRASSPIQPQNVAYWRAVFIENSGNLAKTDRALKQHRNIARSGVDDDAVYTDFVPKIAECILVIPDMHAPYHHPDTLAFLKAVQAAFNPDLTVCLGDELDYHALSFHDSDPNLESAGVELERGKVFLNEMRKQFPDVLVCHSNHGSMHYRRAKAHGIPVQLVRTYRDIVFPGLKVNWNWADSWKVNTPLGKVLFKHQSAGEILADAAHNGCNLVVGHEHGKYAVSYAASSAHLYYEVYSGCLIDKDSLAFAYGRHSRNKPIIGCTVILQGRPVLVPMVLRKDGRWIGKL